MIFYQSQGEFIICFYNSKNFSNPLFFDFDKDFSYRLETELYDFILVVEKIGNELILIDNISFFTLFNDYGERLEETFQMIDIKTIPFDLKCVKYIKSNKYPNDIDGIKWKLLDFEFLCSLFDSRLNEMTLYPSYETGKYFSPYQLKRIIPNDLKSTIKIENSIKNKRKCDIDAVLNLRKKRKLQKVEHVREAKVLLTKEDIRRITFGSCSKVNNIELFYQAMSHRSVIGNTLIDERNRVIYKPYKSNDVLEFIGDSVINSVIGLYLHRRFPNKKEGFLTKTRSIMVRTGTLARMCKFSLLSQFVLAEKKTNPVLEDAFEAFIGAIIIDNDYVEGLDICKKWLFELMDNFVDITKMLETNRNYKDILQTHFNNRTFPKYIDIGKQTRECKVRAVKMFGKVIATASSFRRKDADQLAAKGALDYYNIDYSNKF